MSRLLSSLALAGLGSACLAGAVLASSHSDAPLIKQDPQANLTDVYAFIGTRYDDPTEEVLNVVVNVRPFSEPGDGPHYDRFADDARYSIHITDPGTGETRLRYNFRFSSVDDSYRDLDTILSYGRVGDNIGPITGVGSDTQNYVQTYRVRRVLDGESVIVGNGLNVAPPNAGQNTTPLYNDADGRAVSGASDFASLDVYTQQAIQELATGEVVFAGSRDDSFFADIPGTFDLLNVRILDNNGSLEDGLGQDDGGVDGFRGFNVLTYAIQIPLDLLHDGDGDDAIAQPFDGFFGDQFGVGVYASVDRRASRIITQDGQRFGLGPWIQVNRLSNPVFNEAFVALRDKDRYNLTNPVDDAQFSQYAENPELAMLINAVYGTAFVENGRTDLAAIYIPDVMRVNTTTGPVPLEADDGFNRLGFIGGDTTGGVSSAWPNGRRFGDDVIDIALTALASGPSFDTITLVGDNIASNDVMYNQVFPYAATPHSGTFNRKDPVPAVGDPDLNGDGVINVLDLLILLGAFGTP